MAKKYQISFNTTQGIACQVQFWIDGYSGAVIELIPTASPFILREYNTDEDLFKPIRGQEAEISFITDSSVSIDDFLGNDDSYCQIAFDYDNANDFYWVGYLTQDDFQEEWVDTMHTITLRASEGFGLLKSKELLGSGDVEINGKNSFMYYINQCISSISSISKYSTTSLFKYVQSNLYHTTMDNTLLYSPLDQATTDSRTFETNDGLYEDKYAVLEKINRAWNQTIFQYKGKLRVQRQEELHRPPSDNQRILQIRPLSILGNVWQSANYNMTIGVNETIKPITPQMIRFIKRPTKKDRINYEIDYPSQFFKNQSFQRGDYWYDLTAVSFGTYQSYHVNNWTLRYGQKMLPSTPTGTNQESQRLQKKDIYGLITENFMYIPGGYGSVGQEQWIESNDIPVYKNDIFDISFMWKQYIEGTPNGIDADVAQVFLYPVPGSGNPYYALDTNGKWVRCTTNFDSANTPYLHTKVSTLTDPTDPGYPYVDFQQVSVLSKSSPNDGTLKILFRQGYRAFFPLGSCVKDLQIRYQPFIFGKNTDVITGQYIQFEKDEDIKANFEDEIYFDDNGNKNLKGILFDTSNETLTPEWYRYRYPSESEPFKKQNLIGFYAQTKFHRNKIDATFYGLHQGSLGAIGLVNTFTFVDDNPTKTYAILNLRSIDFANAIWSASLIEVWDSTRDTLGSTATLVPATYSSGVDIPITFTNNAYFIKVGTTQLKYIGTTPIIVSIVCNVVGNANATLFPTDAFFVLRKTSLLAYGADSVIISSNPTSVNLTFTASSVTLVTNDLIYLNIPTIDPWTIGITSGTISIDTANSYPNYTTNYINK